MLFLKMRLPCLAMLTLLCFASTVNAKNNVVVIPLFDDSTPAVYAPIKSDEAPRSDYYIHSETAVDLITGLEWQRHEQSLFDRTWSDANQYCRQLNLRDHNDWRLPSIKELIGITDYTRFAPALSVQAFPSPNSSRDYWSNTIDPVNSSLARTIDVWNGQVRNAMRTHSRFVRCVRAGNSSGSTFIDHNDGTIEDLSFGLMWEKATFGSGPGNLIAATNYCNELDLGGFRDWRVPALKELVSLVEVRAHTEFEINAIFEYHNDYRDREQLLTTTTNVTNTPEVWAVRFNQISPNDSNGSTVYSVPKTGYFNSGVKCVRNTKL
ncbi:hypothetical protein GCM10008090_10150 [Arenicella chitinivorans]|uniref:Lcl C-terminal domain-containing protein n=1 Tax=Arenicella chitinivorans TaxID=1329800 RepID=A0A918RML1_9GAMM|nr:DUF1566 domain-containing protein [Arenicella chitinivorans]GHA03152.1 hypothetical protein GCM10008090_10150 [Arenicella chitinivorans]